MSGRRSLFAQVLEEGDAPPALYKYLANKWAVPEALPGVRRRPLPPIEYKHRDGSRWPHRIPCSQRSGNSRLEGAPKASTSSLPQDFEDNDHRPAAEGEDYGVRLVKSCGLTFLPRTTADITKDQGPRATIAEVISHAFVGPRDPVPRV